MAMGKTTINNTKSVHKSRKETRREDCLLFRRTKLDICRCTFVWPQLCSIVIWASLQVERFSNKIARYFKRNGFQRGDTVALLLENRPEFVCLWLGLAKIGVVTALINTNLVGDPLIHSITVASSKALIFGQDFKQG